MRHSTHFVSESNNPRTTGSFAVGLPDSPDMEIAAALSERLAMDAERHDELMAAAQQAAEDAQQMADLDSDYLDLVGVRPILEMLDAADRKDFRTVRNALVKLVAGRRVYRTQFLNVPDADFFDFAGMVRFATHRH